MRSLAYSLLVLALILAWAQTPTDADYPTEATWRGITVENAGMRSRGGSASAEARTPVVVGVGSQVSAPLPIPTL